MKKLLVLMAVTILCIPVNAQDIPAYRIYHKNGKPATWADVIKDAMKSDVIFFGELHNNPICHWLELELAKGVYDQDSNLILAAEMFEADNQIVLNEYLQGKIKERNFTTECRVWPNYDTDYKPLVEFAKEKGLPFVAANVPRRYANMIYTGGFEALDSLNEAVYKWMAPLPIPYDSTLKSYRDMVDEAGGHGGENLPKAQALKDATMAWFISNNFRKGSRMIHYNGAYHSNNGEGILWYLNKSKGHHFKTLAISSTEQDELSKLTDEEKDLGDYIIVITSDMCSTY